MPTAVGIGVSSAAKADDLTKVLHFVRDLHVTALATLKGKEAHPLIVEAQHVLSVPLLTFDAGELEKMTAFTKNPSERVFDFIGCHSVAEAASLAACGKSARLIVEKKKFGGITIAVARQAGQ